MLTTEDWMIQATEHTTALEHQNRLKKREEIVAHKKKADRRNFIIGELVSK